MNITAYIGMQAGDEGKGLFVAREIEIAGRKAYLIGKTVLNSRFQGGANAGHTVEFKGEKYILHQLPSGLIFLKEDLPIKGFLGDGVSVNPKKLVEEINGLKERGIIINPNNFGVSSNAHVTLDYHIFESLRTYDTGKRDWSSTGSGICPTAIDKSARRGIRFMEFLNIDSFRSALIDGSYLERIREIKDENGNRVYSGYDDFIDSYKPIIKELQEFATLESDVFNDSNIICGIAEGAQGIDLDENLGMYPGITSSNPSRPPHRPNILKGVFKAYESSVGIGKRPFISQIKIKTFENMLRNEWGEHGSTTGKDRCVGWFDVVKGRQRIRESEVDEILLTCLDRLEFLGKINSPVEVVVGYKFEGYVYDKWIKEFSDRQILRSIEPVTQSFDPWTQTLEKDGKTLTPNAGKYVEFLEDKLNKEFSAIGWGPDVRDYGMR